MHSTIAFRFPEGTEFRMTEKVPRVGDVLSRDGARWIVTEVATDRNGNTVVALRPVDRTA